MIHIAAYKLLIADENGKPTELDMGLLEKNLADSFRKLGFTDIWMAEDVAMTVEEKIRESDSTLLTSKDVDAFVISVLNASGFSDVARDYAQSCGKDVFEDARRSMNPWSERMDDVLRRALPLTETQLQGINGLLVDILKKSGIEIASDKFLVDLAIHLLVNDVKPDVVNSALPDWRTGLSTKTREFMCQSIIKPLPISEIFPRARAALRMSALSSQYAEGWVSAFSLCGAFSSIAPHLLELLTAMRKNIGEKYPLQADSPAHVILPDFTEFITRQPNLWRKRDRDEIKNIAEQAIQENVIEPADFPIALSVR